MTDRRSRFSRSGAPSRFLLTERDRAICIALWDHGWLLREDLAELVGLASPSVANARLRSLFDAELVGRVRAGTVNFGLTPVYVLGPAAVPLVAEAKGLPVAAVRGRVLRHAEPSPVLLPHDLLLNKVRIRITKALGAAGAAPLRWNCTGECHDAFAPGRALRPDGYFQLSWQGLVYSFFVELDCATTDLARMRDKFARYRDYRAGGAYRARYGVERFRVLTATPTPSRREALRQAAEAAEGGFWFALTDELLADASPFRPIWNTGRDPELRPLLRECG